MLLLRIGIYCCVSMLAISHCSKRNSESDYIGIFARAFRGMAKIQLQNSNLIQSASVVNIYDCFFCGFALNLIHCSKFYLFLCFYMVKILHLNLLVFPFASVVDVSVIFSLLSVPVILLPQNIIFIL